ncbi:WXG100 family type VII secretion target [Nakamurella endophytica]|uniref:ESAT-6-like protein n=1 Tax=Nakamurella endophytica TaxID=1748367 RepID=A0A917T327_9ACTN|nr:WXG100 family type VII secretion target [Nakamurella endophytica]GGM08628.1 hypothetical protein GCM10011594_30680 [Nakamurella endophytica]
MQGISITSDRVVAMGGAAEAVGAELTREIAAAREILEGIRAGWRSDQAAPRYAAALEGYLQEAAELRDALVGHGAALERTGRAFAEAESALAAGLPQGS